MGRRERWVGVRLAAGGSAAGGRQARRGWPGKKGADARAEGGRTGEKGLGRKLKATPIQLHTFNSYL